MYINQTYFGRVNLKKGSVGTLSARRRVVILETRHDGGRHGAKDRPAALLGGGKTMVATIRCCQFNVLNKVRKTFTGAASSFCPSQPLGE